VGIFKKKPKTEVSVHSETIDASNLTGLGGEIMETLKEHGIEPGQSQVIDASSIPGLSKDIMGALNQAGVWQQAFGAMAGAAAPDDDDPVSQLAKLADLHKSGVLSDREFAVAKQKLLDERWQDK
jgi:hypothetical protein